MQAYQNFIFNFNFLFSLLIISFAWNSSFFVKDKIDRLLLFLSLLGIYGLLILQFGLNDADAVSSNDDVKMFIYESIHGNIFCNLYVYIGSLICLVILALRILKKWLRPAD